MALTPIVRNSKTCARERIVSGILSASVVAMMKTTCGGGSSIDLSSALNDEDESWCTSSMMKTRFRSRTGAIASPLMITSRMLSTPVCVAASISSTSMSRPCAISTQASQTPHGSAVGPVDAVERPRQQARSRRLADPAWSGEDERLMDTSAGDGVPQRTRHGLLADDIIEALWTPLASKDLIHGREAMTNVD